MMIPSSRPPGSPEEEERQQMPTVDIPKEDDEDEDAPEDVLLKDQPGRGDPLRQRRGKPDAMDVDG